MSTKLLIVGAGVMGSVLGHYAQSHGFDVTWFDDRRPNSGSIPSAGLCHPNWSPLPDKERKMALELLDERYGLSRVALGPHSVPFVSPRKFLQQDVDTRTVVKVGGGWLYTADGIMHTGRVVVANGCWASNLWHKATAVRALAGSAFIWDKPWPDNHAGLLKTWAPYKQIVAFERDPGTIWGGDGSAILSKNYSEDRRADSQDRVGVAIWPVLHTLSKPTEIVGYRPYVKGLKQGVCEQIMNKTWLLTGGGKSGTLLAAHYARQLLPFLRLPG